jgi:glycosyltransferase involved in cell wall biosynthesis
MKVAFLWNGLSGYHNACLKELATRYGVELFVCHEAFKSSAPYEESQFAWMKKRIAWRKSSELGTLQQELHEFQPDILIYASWNKPVYRAIAKSFAGKAFRVMGMDNCWQGTIKQRLGVLVAPYYVRPLADAVWLPGERQAVFAKKLGFEAKAIMWGSLSCDQPPIAHVYVERVKQNRPLPHAFLYVGRFAREKGLDTMVQAYERYRKRSSDPWPLVCCGVGPLRSILEGKDGIRVEGFVQPRDMPMMLGSAGCFILASDFEPWALVVHEATSAGLPVIASEKVGAAVHLVRPCYNGFIFSSGDVEDLACLMLRISSMSDERLESMSQASYSLSQQFSPIRWADTLIESYAAHSGMLAVSTVCKMSAQT